MDIHIVDVASEGPWTYVSRIEGGAESIERMPRETLAIRAAEYNLEVDDPRALEIVLLERFYNAEDPDEIHPLYKMRNIDDALNEAQRRIQVVKDEHNVTGLEVAKDVLLEHAPNDIAWAVQHQRDIARDQVRRRQPSFTERIVNHSLGMLQSEAIDIEQEKQREAERRG